MVAPDLGWVSPSLRLPPAATLLALVWLVLLLLLPPPLLLPLLVVVAVVVVVVVVALLLGLLSSSLLSSSSLNGSEAFHAILDELVVRQLDSFAAWQSVTNMMREILATYRRHRQRPDITHTYLPSWVLRREPPWRQTCSPVRRAAASHVIRLLTCCRTR